VNVGIARILLSFELSPFSFYYVPHCYHFCNRKSLWNQRPPLLVELISRVCAKFGISVKDLVSKSRNRQLSQARGVICYLAVDELGYSGDDVARRLRISGRGVSDCRERGKKILDNPKIISEYLT